MTVVDATFAYGFPTQQQTTQVHVPSFAISTSPITVAQYKACVDGGACSTPRSHIPACSGPMPAEAFGPTYSDDPASRDLPVTCATPSQAAQYCQWVGAALPTPEQWVLAARGPSIQQYPWGNAPPDCTRASLPCANVGALSLEAGAPQQSLATGQHPQGASPAGLLDVLLTPRELLAGHGGSAQAACVKGGFCVAGSTTPASIDMVWPIQDETDTFVELTQPLFGFRCVWEVK